MAFASTASSNYTQALTTWLNKNFVSDLEYELQFQKFTEKAIIPPGSGNVGRFLAWSTPVVGTFLTEGTPTEGETSFTIAGTDVTMKEMGQYIKTTELMMYAAVSTAREKLRKRLRDNSALTIDAHVRALASHNTAASTMYCVTAAAGAQVTAPATVVGMNAAALITAKKLLRGGASSAAIGGSVGVAGAMGFEGVSGHPNRQYAAIISTISEQQMVQEVSTGKITWSTINLGGAPGPMAQEKAVNGYLGSVFGVAVYVTQNTISATLTSVSDLNYVLADGGLGAMAFGDMQPEVIINDVNSPYKNVNSIAWHTIFNAALIDATRVVKLYSNALA